MPIVKYGIYVKLIAEFETDLSPEEFKRRWETLPSFREKLAELWRDQLTAVGQCRVTEVNYRIRDSLPGELGDLLDIDEPKREPEDPTRWASVRLQG